MALPIEGKIQIVFICTPNFLNKTYEVVYLGNKVTKVYGYKILDSEISKLITLIVRANMEAIKSIYKDE